MKILISGAGIGGLTTALCALHFGHEPHVFERAQSLEEVGAGIQLPPNAMKVLDALGLTQKLRAVAFEPYAIQTRMGRSGREIFTVPLGDITTARWGAPYLHIHRADYIRVLSEALTERAPGALHLGQAVTRYAQESGYVTVELQDGGTASGDVLVGADGIQSTIAQHMLGSRPPCFTGNYAWRAVVPTDALGELAPPPTSCAWFGAGAHAVTYRLRGGALTNFVGVVESQNWTEEGWSVRGDKADLRRDFAGWHPVIAAIINAAPEDALYRWALYDRASLPRWTDGRVALLGDAAHPMLPFWAQGAAMAVEDGWALCASLINADVARALSGYAAMRQPRTALMQKRSRDNMRTFHHRSALSKAIHYGPMWIAGKLFPSVIRSRFDSVYGFDITKT